MNIAQMLAERMKSPGAMADFKERTSNPDAIAQLGDAVTGSDKQEPYPMDTGDTEGEDRPGDSGLPEDAGLGMLTSAHAHAHGKAKASLGKAIAHGKAKHQAMRGGKGHKHGK